MSARGLAAAATEEFSEEGVSLGGATTFGTSTAIDLRGEPTALKLDHDLPFVPRRLFAVFGVPSTHRAVNTRIVSATKHSIAYGVR